MVATTSYETGELDGAFEDPNLGDVLDAPEPEYDWLIEGLLERRDRLIVTGPEGAGKSTLLRQMAVQAGAGVHPFDPDADLDPVRVVLVDLENGRRHVRRMLRPLANAGGEKARTNVFPVIRPEGIDLHNDEDADWLADRLTANRADLLVIGPLYKLADGDPEKEEPAKAASRRLDELREEHDITIVLEAHTPHTPPGGRRILRPYGASLWKRWPEFGLHLAAGGTLEHWRGPRDERSWPSALERGGPWPWTPAEGRTLTYARITEECRQAQRVLSVRELTDRIEGTSRSGIQRAIEANRTQHDTLTTELELSQP